MRAKPVERTVVPRTVRFPERLRQRLADDAERCGRSFEAQVIALLRKHYGEDVDIAPSPDSILALAASAVAGINEPDRRAIARPIGTDTDRWTKRR